MSATAIEIAKARKAVLNGAGGAGRIMPLKLGSYL